MNLFLQLLIARQNPDGSFGAASGSPFFSALVLSCLDNV